jgi:hypothetical protein
MYPPWTAISVVTQRKLPKQETERCDITLLSTIFKYEIYVRFEDSTAVVMKSSIFWDITPCSPLKVNRRFGWTCHLHLQGRRISQARNQREARSKQSTDCYLLHAGFLHGLFFGLEDGGDKFLRNVGWLFMKCVKSNLRSLFAKGMGNIFVSQVKLHTIELKKCKNVHPEISH